MLTPWVKPVTAGNRIAKMVQNGTSRSAPSQPCSRTARLKLVCAPAKNDANAPTSTNMMTN